MLRLVYLYLFIYIWIHYQCPVKWSQCQIKVLHYKDTRAGLVLTRANTAWSPDNLAPFLRTGTGGLNPALARGIIDSLPRGPGGLIPLFAEDGETDSGWDNGSLLCTAGVSAQGTMNPPLSNILDSGGVVFPKKRSSVWGIGCQGGIKKEIRGIRKRRRGTIINHQLWFRGRNRHRDKVRVRTRNKTRGRIKGSDRRKGRGRGRGGVRNNNRIGYRVWNNSFCDDNMRGRLGLRVIHCLIRVHTTPRGKPLTVI